jgi:hypothetical protein
VIRVTLKRDPEQLRMCLCAMGLKVCLNKPGEEFLFDGRSPSSVKPANYLASRDGHVGPDAGVPIKPVFGLMG